MRRCLLALTLLGSLGLAGACDPQQGSGAPGPCPPCECKCECGTQVGGSQAGSSTGEPTQPVEPTQTQPQANRNELTELVASANRKMAHGDGPGCLADIARVETLDPPLARQLEITRAQCLMASGECQKGKQLIVEWYIREQAFTREFAERTAESIASMRCRGGDSTERDRLLAALYDLSDGAYMNKRDVAFCKDRVAIIEDLGKKVKPRDAEDTQITGGIQALFHTSAECFARAGDCKTAYAYYRRLFPSDGLTAIPDPQQREQIVRDSFESSIVLCKP